MFWCESRSGDESVVCFRGVLDATSAREVRRFLHIETTGKVILDLSQAAGIDYYGLSALVTEIAQSNRAVLLRGLHANHVRILRYLGLDPARFGLPEGPCPDVG